MKKSIYLLLIALAAVGFSCSKEKGLKPGAGERDVEMTFLLPGAAVTRAIATAEENEIKDLTLLVFDKDGTYQYSRYAWEKSTSGATGIYTSTLKMDTDITIYFAVNWPTILTDLDKAGIEEGKSKLDQVTDALVMERADDMDLETDGLPMWGHAHNVNIEDKVLNLVKDVQLIRSVASIDISMGDPNFILEEGHVFYAADKGYLPYNENSAYMQYKSGVLRAVAPFTPQGFDTSIELEHIVKPGETEIKNKFYVYENSTPVDKTTGVTTRTTKVVVGGIWDDPAGCGETTYYPLTLRTKIGENQYEKKQAMRNNKYSILVTKVNGDGYGSLEDAKDADDINVDYEVIDWEDNEDGDLIIDGPMFFYRNKSKVTLYRPLGSDESVVFRTNYDLADIEIKFDTDTDYVKALSLDHHTRFGVEIIDETGSGDTAGRFKITAKQEYASSGNTAVLNVRVKRIQFNIEIEQVGSHPDDWNHGGNIDHQVDN